MPRVRWAAAATTVVAAGLLVVWPPATGRAQPAAPAPADEAKAAVPPAAVPPAAAAAEPDLVLKMYDVSDLTRGVADRPVRSAVVPPTLLGTGTLTEHSYPGSAGFISSTETPTNDPRIGAIAVDVLVKLVQEQVELGEPPHGSVSNVGEVLIVRQTPANQRRTAGLLEALRAARPVGRGVEVVAHWVMLKPTELKAMFKPGGREVDPAALVALPPEAVYARSSLRALTGQTVTLLSGRARTVVRDQLASVGAAVAAYDPEVDLMLAGALVRMSVAVAGETATVELVAAAADWDEPGKPSTLRMRHGGTAPVTQPTGGDGSPVLRMDLQPGGDATAEVDRLNTTTLHLQTTARLPVGRPTIVGGMTREPTAAPPVGPRDARHLYLVLEVTPTDATPAPAAGGANAGRP